MMSKSGFLRPAPAQALPLGSVTPGGWLEDQLRVQSQGLSGCIGSVWDDLSDRSAWLGGDGESWERGPYYMDGLVPLARLRRDPVLEALAARWIEALLASQRPDGSFGPSAPQSRVGPDWWYLTPALKALVQHHEATGDARVVPFLLRFFAYQERNLERVPLREWARARAGETDWVLQWLVEQSGEAGLVRHRDRLLREALDWAPLFDTFPFATLPWPFSFRHETHVVNVAMALKSPAVAGRWAHRPDEGDASLRGLDALLRHHGQAHGAFSGDEHLAGTDPTRGTELCAVVELMFSLGILFEHRGDDALLDLLERVAFNALPAAFDGAMLAHQYDQQVNQVLCTEAPRRWINNGPRSNCFGLAPNFGCCAANFHQGWPKLVRHLWFRRGDGAFATGVLGPSELALPREFGDARLVCATPYPFGEELRYELRGHATKPVVLELRTPHWATGATLDEAPLGAGRRTRVVLDGVCRPAVTLRLPFRVQTERRPSGGLCLLAGPLVFALPIPHRFVALDGLEMPRGDHAVHPTAPWAFALDLDQATCTGLTVAWTNGDRSPYRKRWPWPRLVVPGRSAEGWGLVDDSAGPVPASPCKGSGARVDLELVPYGATVLRVTEFPTLAAPITR